MPSPTSPMFRPSPPHLPVLPCSSISRTPQIALGSPLACTARARVRAYSLSRGLFFISIRAEHASLFRSRPPSIATSLLLPVEASWSSAFLAHWSPQAWSAARSSFLLVREIDLACLFCSALFSLSLYIYYDTSNSKFRFVVEPILLLISLLRAEDEDQ